MVAETARDRIAYFIWCAKYDHLDRLTTGENHLLYPPEQLLDYQIEENKQFYQIADLTLEMLRSDILKLVRGGEEGLKFSYDGWSTGIQEALDVLGWKPTIEE
jgi:hypothetical protein